MAQKKELENFRVVVRPKDPGDFGMLRIGGCTRTTEQERDECLRIIAEIKRHVNDIDSAVIEYDTKLTCEHCAYQWTEDSKDYNGGCCQHDQETQEAKEYAAAEDEARDIAAESQKP